KNPGEGPELGRGHRSAEAREAIGTPRSSGIAGRPPPRGWPDGGANRPGSGGAPALVPVRMAFMIGQLHSVVIDAPDAHALATFYADLLGMEVSKGAPGDDWVVVSGAGYRLAFQQAPD